MFIPQDSKGLFNNEVLRQCGTNIKIFEYIQIYLDKYIHLSKPLLIFSKANIFGYSFVINLYWGIYLDIHSSNIYDSKYNLNFHCFPKMVKNDYYWSKMVQYGSKITQNMKIAKIVQNNLGKVIWYLNIFKYFGGIYSFAKIFVDFFLGQIYSNIHLSKTNMFFPHCPPLNECGGSSKLNDHILLHDKGGKGCSKIIYQQWKINYTESLGVCR